MKLSTLQFTLLYCSIQCFYPTLALHRGSASASSLACLSCRGGQQPPPPYDNYNPPPPPQDPDHIFQESVQDRVDQWRQQQIQHRDKMTNVEKVALRENTGRMKLLVSVGRGARGVLFGVLMWRNLTLMEVVDKTTKGSMRNFLFGMLAVLFLGNLAGVSASFGTGGHATTRRCKAILNVDKLVEIFLILWYFLRLSIIPKKLVPREVYVASIFHSIFFLVQCQQMTKLSW